MKKLALFLLFALAGCGEPPGPVQPKKQRFCSIETQVEEVGGCASTGWCGVRLANGEKKLLPYPIRGEKYCWEWTEQ